jgi:Leucine-rich repeat (LRR) protein
MKKFHLIVLLFITFFAQAQIVNIPDANFKNALVNTLCVDLDGDGNGDVDADTNDDGEIQESEAQAVLRLYVNNSNISSLEGIQSFSNLETLWCWHNDLTNLDISQNSNLRTLVCYGNQLSSLDVSQNQNLENLFCSQNQLTTLDFSQNPNFKDLMCFSNQLVALDLRNGNNMNMVRMCVLGNPSLSCIEVDDVNATYPNCDPQDCFGWCKEATTIYAEDCALGQVVNIPDANFKSALVNTLCVDLDGDGNGDIDADTNDDGEIHESEAQAVLRLVVNGRNIASLVGIESFSNLLGLSCSSNQLTTLDVSQNQNLELLSCTSNQLGSLDVSQNQSLEFLACYANELTALDLTQNPNLARLSCSANRLITLDLGQNPNLEDLICRNNLLQRLNLKNGNTSNISIRMWADENPNLSCIQIDDENASYPVCDSQNNSGWCIDSTTIYSEDCYQGQIVNIPDANFKHVLTNLNCVDTDGDLLGDSDADLNNDGEIQVSEAEAVFGLNVANRSISSLEGIESFINLRFLNCRTNLLTSLDVSQNANLERLNCRNNNIASLDCSQNLYLEYLGCSYNWYLDSLNVTQNTNLKYLDCTQNSITFLDVSQHLNLEYLYCGDNSITILDVSQSPNLEYLDCRSNDLFSLNLNNGNNENLQGFNSTNNPLACIQVDNVIYANSQNCQSNNWCKESLTMYSEDCGIGSIINIPDVNFKNTLINTLCVDLDGDGVGDINVDTNNDSEIQIEEAMSVLRLNVANRSISSLEGIQSFTRLKFLDCKSNFLTSLDVTQNTELDFLFCNNNLLTGLDVTQNWRLGYLVCSNNPLGSLNVTQNIFINFLVCSSNELTTLDLTQNQSLFRLSCSANQLTTLDLRSNLFLEDLVCTHNPLTTLNLKNGYNSRINVRMWAYNNPLLTCIIVDDENAIYPECDRPNNSGWCIDSTTIYAEECVLGLEDYDSITFTMFPNPAQNVLNIESKKMIENVKIYSLQGQLIKEGNNTTVDVSDLSYGLYFVQVSIEGITLTKKFIKS